MFSRTLVSSKDEELYNKVLSLQWIPPSGFGISEKFVQEHLWNICIKELQKIETGQTPSEKLKCVVKVR